jgi:hypothetical protein
MSFMSASVGAAAQLRTIGWLEALFAEEGIDYWLFGGWAVDFHARRVTRDHIDIDIDVAVSAADWHRIATLFEAEGVVARVVGLESLVEDKSAPRLDPTVAANDRADVDVLTSLAAGG